MPAYGYLLIALGVLGFVCCVFVWKSDRQLLSAGVGFLGLVAGMIIGLTETPIIASVVTSSFTLVGALLPIYLNKDRQDTLPKLEAWLGPFATLLLAGILSGVTIRVNELLFFPTEPKVTNLREAYQKQGFTPDQVNSIMSAQAEVLSKKEPSALPADPKPHGSIALKSAMSSIAFASAEGAFNEAKKKDNPSEALAVLENDANPAHAEAFKKAIAEARADVLADLKRTDPKATEASVSKEMIFNRLVRTHEERKARN
jgi:hypothetical protein